jgi:hypothetical protein
LSQKNPHPEKYIGPEETINTLLHELPRSQRTKKPFPPWYTKKEKKAK